jgi:hypothetical protein
MSLFMYVRVESGLKTDWSGLGPNQIRDSTYTKDLIYIKIQAHFLSCDIKRRGYVLSPIFCLAFILM